MRSSILLGFSLGIALATTPVISQVSASVGAVRAQAAGCGRTPFLEVGLSLNGVFGGRPDSRERSHPGA